MFIINPYRYAGAGTPAFSYRNTYVNTANQTNYTFSASDLGTPHASRLVIVGVRTDNSNPSAVTVDGTAATRVIETGAGNSDAEIWQAVSTANATGDIVVSVATANNCVIHVWAGYPGSTTAVDSVANTAVSTTTVTLTDLAKTNGGFTVLMATAGSGVTHAVTQNGAETVTENYDAAIEGTQTTIAASHVNTATTTADDYTDTVSSTASIRMAGASWA